MFEIPVGDLLASYNGDSKELEFNGEVYDGYYEDISFIKPLELKIKLIGTDDGITLVIERIKAHIKYDDQIKFVELSNITREFRERFTLEDPDDIKYISKGKTIDLKDIIREEILIQIIA